MNRYSPRSAAWRLFFTCWLVYVIHFATNIARENYLAVAIGDHLSFRVDEYANLHDDLFETPGRGWHTGANPGASILAAIPYAILRPVIDRIVNRVQQGRAGHATPPKYDTPVEKDRLFFEEAWRRGLDVKLGIAAFVMQSLCMAPISAGGVVAMFRMLHAFSSGSTALWLALLYAFGTPVFFRAGFLNHNMMLGHIALAGFLVASAAANRKARQAVLTGLAGGACLLLDYSGAVALLALGGYTLVKRPAEGGWVRNAGWFALGAAGPVALLWFYQWQSFGHPFYPPQHWMPPVEYITIGYQGVSWPRADLLSELAFDYQYGLFTSSPILLLALAYPLLRRAAAPGLSRLETIWIYTFSAAIWLFFGGVNYTPWQFNTGVRYLAPAIPFLFLPAASVLLSLPRILAYLVAIFSVALSWCLAMYRDVSGGQVELYEAQRGLGVLDPVLHVFLGGFQLPAFTTLSRIQGGWQEYLAGGPSPLPLLCLVAGIVFVIWLPKPAKRPDGESA